MWHLCGDPTVGPGARAAVFISNRARAVAVAHQRISVIPGFPVVWDYHVVMAHRSASQGWCIWDLDSALGVEVPLSRWVEDAFGGGFGFGDEHAPMFRVVGGDVFRETLVSDRGHMRREDGTYESPLPSWPQIGRGPANLMRFVAMEPGFVGEVVGPEQLSAALDRSASPDA